MAGSAEAEVIDRSKLARETQSSNEEVSQHISTNGEINKPHILNVLNGLPYKTEYISKHYCTSNKNHNRWKSIRLLKISWISCSLFLLITFISKNTRPYLAHSNRVLLYYGRFSSVKNEKKRKWNIHLGIRFKRQVERL